MNQWAALLLDTETTGFDEPEVIELAYMGPLFTPKGVGSIRAMRFKPNKEISLGAMAAHHIIMADLLNEPSWPGRWALPADLQSVRYLVGHNIDYDWRAIGSPDLKRVCTLALARRVWPLLDSHTLSALTYYLHPHPVARVMLNEAHSAATDVELLGSLLGVLWAKVGCPGTWEEFWQISERARIPERMTFGKHGPNDGKPGMLISELRKCDRGYVKWLLSGACDQVNDDPYLRQALTE